jgi:hypothetical protein
MARPLGTARPPKAPATPENLVDEWDVTWPVNVDACGTCGRPSKTTELLTFRLWSVRHSKWAGYYRLCGKCWERSNERLDPDPLNGFEEAS